MNVCVYSHEKDPVVESLSADTIKISVADLLNNISIFDKIDNGTAQVQWTLPSGETVSNDQNTLLINRVHFLDSDLFCDFVEEDKTFCESEFRAYLSFSLSAFPKKVGQPGPYGLSYPSYNLIEQWHRVNRKGYCVATPKYYYGKFSSVPDELKERGIFKNTYDGLSWKVSMESQQFSDNDIVFVHERPEGIPVIVHHCLGDFKILENTDLGSEQNHKLIKYASEIACALQSSFSQILFFINGKSIVFGSLQNKITYLPNEFKTTFKERLMNI